MIRSEGTTDKAPTPVGPYSQSVRVGNIVAAAGQAGVDPATGAVASTEVAGQTIQTFKNIEAVLAASGATLDDVFRVDVYLSDLADFAAMNEQYAKVFTPPYPARTTVGVQLPTGLKVEITALAMTE
jgi:reactive intermediate/imine deaminase